MCGHSAEQKSLEPISTAPGLGTISLKGGESLNVEASAMLASRNLVMQTGIHGSPIAVLKRYVFGGEGAFMNTFTAGKGGGWIAFEEAIEGQIASYDMKAGEVLSLAPGAFVAADSGVKVTAHYAGVKSWWEGLGFTKLKATNTDDKIQRIFFNSPEGPVKIVRVSKKDGPVEVDNDCTLAYTEGLQNTVCRVGGLKGLLFSGEGTINQFEGEGTVFVGSGESADKANYFTRLMRGLAPDPITLGYRATVVVLAGLLFYSPYLESFGKSIENTVRYLNCCKCKGCDPV